MLCKPISKFKPHERLILLNLINQEKSIALLLLLNYNIANLYLVVVLIILIDGATVLTSTFLVSQLLLMYSIHN